MARLGIGTAAVALMLLALFLAGCKAQNDGLVGKEVAAIVNGARIYVDEVNSEYASLDGAQHAQITKANTLAFLIEREILYQEAGKQGFRATDEEIGHELGVFLDSGNMTEAGLEQDLSASGSSIEKLKVTLRKQVMINKLIDSKVSNQFVIKRDEVERAYNENSLASMNITFEQAEKGLIDLLSSQHRETRREAYIDWLMAKADVIIVTVPD